jgi:uncharacterized protein YfaP (DUF2135 family)
MHRLAAFALACAAASAAADVLETPYGGWNYSGLTDRSSDSAYAYPPSPIDRGAQRYRSLIVGQLKAAGPRRPATLIVNGNPMPLYAGEDGRYARPYAFGRGSNSVEVRDGDGSRKRVQTYEANPTKNQAQLRIVLAWDDSQAELDMHVITPDGQHAFWAHPVLTNGGGLDVDTVDGPGPEMFTLASPPRGNYHVFINYWGNYGAEGYHFDESTREKPIIVARVSIIYYENTLQEKRETYVLPIRKIGDLTLVRSFLF